MKPPDRTEISFSLNRSTLVVGLAITAVAILVTFLISYYYNFEVYFRDYIALFTTGIVCTTLFYHSKNIGLTHAYHVEKLSFEREKLKAENERKVAEYSLMICSEWFKPSVSTEVKLGGLVLQAISRNFLRKAFLRSQGR
ncbi:MAG: hypothetical protein J0L67_03700 [Cytophagales bacterium]|nr:hypothetical protein [Cytophagales bacterium]